MCNDLPLKITISDENFVQDDLQQGLTIEGACTTVSVIGKVLGTSKVISFNDFDELY